MIESVSVSVVGFEDTVNDDRLTVYPIPSVVVVVVIFLVVGSSPSRRTVSLF